MRTSTSDERIHGSSHKINNTHHTNIRDGRDSGSSNNKVTILLFVIGEIVIIIKELYYYITE